MKLFFKFFWMGISNLIHVVTCILGFLLPIALSILAYIIIKKLIGFWLSILFSIIICIFAYWIYGIVLHCIEAVKYCKENNTDSLETAWIKTKWEWE